MLDGSYNIVLSPGVLVFICVCNSFFSLSLSVVSECQQSSSIHPPLLAKSMGPCHLYVVVKL